MNYIAKNDKETMRFFDYESPQEAADAALRCFEGYDKRNEAAIKENGYYCVSSAPINFVYRGNKTGKKIFECDIYLL